MSYTRNFDAAYDWTKNQFVGEQDTTRPVFYIEQFADKNGELQPVEMVKVISPGETLNVFGGKVTEEHKRRWAPYYDAFKRGEEMVNGTSLSKWPEVANNADFLSELRHFRFFTVEDLANLKDGDVNLFHGAYTWRAKARAFLKKQHEDQELRQKAGQVAEMDDLKSQIAALQAQMLANASAVAPKRRGRPRKGSVPEVTQ